MNLLKSLILSLTLISGVSRADIDELKIRENSPEENFPSYLVTPLEKENHPSFYRALYLSDAPGRSVCLSVSHYLQVKDGYEAGKIYKQDYKEDKGYAFEDLLLGALIGVVIGGFGATVFQH